MKEAHTLAFDDPDVKCCLTHDPCVKHGRLHNSIIDQPAATQTCVPSSDLPCASVRHTQRLPASILANAFPKEKKPPWQNPPWEPCCFKRNPPGIRSHIALLSGCALDSCTVTVLMCSLPFDALRFFLFFLGLLVLWILEHQKGACG